MFHAFLIDCVEKLMQILVWGSILPMNQQYLFGLGFQSASPRITICRNTTRSRLLLFPPFSKLPTTNLSLVRARVSQCVSCLFPVFRHKFPGFSRAAMSSPSSRNSTPRRSGRSSRASSDANMDTSSSVQVRRAGGTAKPTLNSLALVAKMKSSKSGKYTRYGL